MPRVWRRKAAKPPLTAYDLVDRLEGLGETEREIVRTRWAGEVARYNRLWASQRLGYYALRVPMVVGAATVPVLASLSVPRIATALVGLAVAILTGLDSLLRLGGRWRQGRQIATAISFEGWRFVELSGKLYEDRDRKEAYKVFLSRLEDLNESLSMARLDLFSEADERRDRHGLVPK